MIAKLPLIQSVHKPTLQVVNTSGMSKSLYWDCVVESKNDESDDAESSKDGDSEGEDQ